MRAHESPALHAHGPPRSRTSSITHSCNPCSLSMGGMIAQTIAINHPGVVRAVVSVASSYGGQGAPQPPGGIDAMLK